MWSEWVGQCWQAQGSPLPVWTPGSLHCSRFWQSREWHRGLGHEIFHMHCWMRSCSAISGWRKKALKVGGYLKIGVWSTASHLFTKIISKKLRVQFQEYPLCLIWSISVEKNLFPYILSLLVAFFKAVITKSFRCLQVLQTEQNIAQVMCQP